MLTNRSREKELLDLGPEYYTQHEYVDCLKKLFMVNKLLGFFRSTVKVFKSLPGASTVLDVGCGGGLFLIRLNQIFPNMKMLGVDISAAAIKDAEQSLQAYREKNPEIQVSFQLQ